MYLYCRKFIFIAGCCILYIPVIIFSPVQISFHRVLSIQYIVQWVILWGADFHYFHDQPSWQSKRFHRQNNYFDWCYIYNTCIALFPGPSACPCTHTSKKFNSGGRGQVLRQAPMMAVVAKMNSIASSC